MLIYKITNKITGKFYIGQTTQLLSERWRRHCFPSSRCSYISNAKKKYGKENFEIKTLLIVDSQKELDRLEIHWIKKFNTLAPNGYNLLIGGKGGKLSEATKVKMSKIQKGRKHSEETKKRLSEAHKGKKLSTAHKKRISEGVKKTAGIRGHKVTYTHSKESKQKIVKALIGRPVSKETREKISNSNKNKKRTPDQKERIKKGIAAVGGSPRKKQVLHLETGIQYDSATATEIALNLGCGSVGRVASGKLKTTKGQHFKYI